MQPNADGEYVKRQLADGRWLYVIALTYGRARLCISSKFSPLIFDDGY